MLTQSVDLLTQLRKVYYVHAEHPTLERVFGEIEIYDLPLEERITPRFRSASLHLGAIDLKSSSGELIQGYIDWRRIPNADVYRGKVTGWLCTSKDVVFLKENEGTPLRGADDVIVPDYIATQESDVFSELAKEIVRAVLERDSQRHS